MDVHHDGVVPVIGYIYVSDWLHNVEALSGTRERKCTKSIGIVKDLLYQPKICFIYDEKRGNVGLVNATQEKFALVSSFKITQGASGPFWSHPVIHNGKIYIRHGNALMVYNIRS